MVIKKIILTTLILNLFVNSNAISDIDDKGLHKNPFIKPSYISIVTKSGDVNTDHSYSQADIQLHATLLSEDKSLVNVDGIIIFIGEKVKGYELISVGVGTAVFKKNDEEITLSVSELHQKLQK